MCILRSVSRIAFFIVGCFMVASASATLLDWDGNESIDGSFDGDFDVAANWNPTQIPAAGHMANFNANASYTVTFRSDEAADDFRVIAGNVTFLSDSTAVRAFELISGAMDGNVSGGNLTIGSDTNPILVSVGDVMNIGSSGSGSSEVTVDGTQSLLKAVGIVAHHVGHNGGTGTLRVINKGTAIYEGTLKIGVDNGSNGYVLDSLGGNMYVGNIEIATVGTGGSGSLQVTENDSWVQMTAPGSTLTIGSAAGNVGSLTTASGGKFTTGTGITTVNATGTINVGLAGDGIFEALGDVNIVGGNLRVGADAGDMFTLSNGKQLTATAGGVIDFAGPHNLTGTFNILDGTLNADGLLTVDSATLRLDGGVVNANKGLDASFGSLDFADGTLTVTNGVFVAPTFQLFLLGGEQFDDLSHLVLGTGATGNVSTSLLVGYTLGSGHLSVINGATLSSNLGSFAPKGQGTVDGTNSMWTITTDLLAPGGTLDIQNDGDVSATNTRIDSDQFNLATQGTINLSGMGSTLTNTATLNVGDMSGGILNIAAKGVAYNPTGIVGTQAGSRGNASVDGSGSAWINTTSLVVGQLGNGTLQVTAGGTVSSSEGFIGSEVGSVGAVIITGSGSTWTNSGGLSIGGTTSASGGNASLSILDEGLVEVTGSLRIWDHGTLTINGGTLKVDSTDVVGSEATINYAKGTIHLTNAGGYTLGANSGPIDEALGFANAIIPAGGGFIVDEALTVPVGTSLTVVASDVTADELTNDGLVYVTSGTITTATGLNNNADIILVNTSVDSTVNNANGSTITVLGTVDFNDLVNGSGNFFGPGTANFNGGMAPGDSPAEVAFEGNVTFSDTNSLLIELGGTASGTEFDTLDIAGFADIGGSLNVTFVNSFMPSIGNTFAIITAANVLDTFAVENLPDIGPLLWNVKYNTSNVVLEVLSPFSGDFDQDGDVDGRDFLVWQRDPNIGSLTDWQSNYGITLLAAASTSVPEPTSWVLMLLSMLGWKFANLRRI